MRDGLPLKATKSAQKNAACQPAPGVSGGKWHAGASLPLGVRGLIPLYSCPWAKKYNPAKKNWKLLPHLRTKLAAHRNAASLRRYCLLHTPGRPFGAATHTEGGGRPVISVVPFGVGPGWSHGKISRTGMIKRRTM